MRGSSSAAPRRSYYDRMRAVLRDWDALFAELGAQVAGQTTRVRTYYARTAEHWLARYLTHRDEVEAKFDARFARAWQLYLSGTVAAFTSSTLELFQVAFARARHNTMPW